jgi:hypothetical protein
MKDFAGGEVSFAGDAAFAHPLQLAGLAPAGAPPGLLAAPGFDAVAGRPAIKYLRILSRRFLPMPRIASKSSTLLNGPYRFAHLQDFVGGSRADAGNQLQLFRRRRIDIDRLNWRLLGSSVDILCKQKRGGQEP